MVISGAGKTEASQALTGELVGGTSAVDDPISHSYGSIANSHYTASNCLFLHDSLDGLSSRSASSISVYCDV